jgi:hypothetical protein
MCSGGLCHDPKDYVIGYADLSARNTPGVAQCRDARKRISAIDFVVKPKTAAECDHVQLPVKLTHPSGRSIERRRVRSSSKRICRRDSWHEARKVVAQNASSARAEPTNGGVFDRRSPIWWQIRSYRGKKSAPPAVRTGNSAGLRGNNPSPRALVI